MDIPSRLERLALAIRRASGPKTAAISDETRACAKKALRLTEEYHKELGELVKRMRAECDVLETDIDEKQPERFSDAEQAQWWVDLQARKEKADDLHKLLKDIRHEDLTPSTSAKGVLTQYMKDD